MRSHAPFSILALQPTSSLRPLRRLVVTSRTGTLVGSMSTISCKSPTSNPNTTPSWGTRMDLPVRRPKPVWFAFRTTKPKEFLILANQLWLDIFWLLGLDRSLPPKVSHPIPSSSNFVQDVSRRLHNDLVIKIPKKIQTSAPSKSALHEHQSKIKPGDVIVPCLNNLTSTCFLSTAGLIWPSPDQAWLAKWCHYCQRNKWEKAHSGRIWTEVRKEVQKLNCL